MLRALKKVKELIGEQFNKAKFLFLNDMSINRRTRDGVEVSELGGENIVHIARQFIGDTAFIKTLIQSGSSVLPNYDVIQNKPSNWDDDSNSEAAIQEIAQSFQKNKTPWIEGKLGSASARENGIKVPLDAFIQFLHSQEESSEE